MTLEHENTINLITNLIKTLKPEEVIKLVLTHPEIVDCQILTQKDLEEMAERQERASNKVYTSHDVDNYLFSERERDDKC